MFNKKIAFLSLITLSVLLATLFAFTTLNFNQATAQDQPPPPAADLTRSDVIKLIAVADSVNLRGVNLQGVNLSGLDLSGANLAFADLTNANVTEADLTGASLNCATVGASPLFNGSIMPNGDIFTPALDISQFIAPGGGDCFTAPILDSSSYITIVDAADPTGGVDALCGRIPTISFTPFGRSGDLTTDLLTSLQSALDERNVANANLGADPLIVESVTIEGDRADITLSGELALAGACDDSAVDAQIALTIFLYPEINTAYVTLNGTNIRQSFFGLTGSELPDDAVYTRAEIEARYSLPQ